MDQQLSTINYMSNLIPPPLSGIKECQLKADLANRLQTIKDIRAKICSLEIEAAYWRNLELKHKEKYKEIDRSLAEIDGRFQRLAMAKKRAKSRARDSKTIAQFSQDQIHQIAASLNIQLDSLNNTN